MLDRGLRKHVYTATFLGPMRDKVRQKAERDAGFATRVDLALALRARTFAEYDRAVTARLHGFADEHDYWVRASSDPYLRRVHRPTLLLSALDDPLVPPEALPDPSALPPWVRAECNPSWGDRRRERRMNAEQGDRCECRGAMCAEIGGGHETTPCRRES